MISYFGRASLPVCVRVGRERTGAGSRLCGCRGFLPISARRWRHSAELGSWTFGAACQRTAPTLFPEHVNTAREREASTPFSIQIQTSEVQIQIVFIQIQKGKHQIQKVSIQIQKGGIQFKKDAVQFQMSELHFQKSEMQFQKDSIQFQTPRWMPLFQV